MPRARLPCCFGVIATGQVVMLYPAARPGKKFARPTFAEAIEQEVYPLTPNDRASDEDWRRWWQLVPMTRVRLFHFEHEPRECWIPNGTAVGFTNPTDRLDTARLAKPFSEAEYDRLVDLKIWKFSKIAKPQHLDPDEPVQVTADPNAKVGKGRQMSWQF